MVKWTWTAVLFFFLMMRRPPRSPLFPCTTLFRSGERRAGGAACRHGHRAGVRAAHGAVRRDTRERDRVIARRPGEGDAAVGGNRLARRAPIQLDRAPVWTPVTAESPMPARACETD